jgi:two-component sensor histidine kinase
MTEYVKDLVTALLKARQGATGHVSPVLEMEEIFFSLETAVPCGLIVNELVSNSLKHAFRGRKEGKIFLSLNRGDGKVVLTYRDDGPGLARELDLSRSVGLRLIHSLAMYQLRGTVELVHHSGGTEFVFRFPLPAIE